MEGGIVVWVRVRSPEREGEAQEILARFNGKAIRLHEIEIDKRLDDLPLAEPPAGSLARQRTARRRLSREADNCRQRYRLFSALSLADAARPEQAGGAG